MNSITISGRAGNVRVYEPKSPEGKVLLVIGVADRFYLGKGRGEALGLPSDYQTQWWNCKVFGKTASAIQKYVSKGTYVTVVGKVRPDKYVAKDGTTQISNNVFIDQIDFFNERRMDGKDGGPSHDPSVKKLTTSDEDKEDDWNNASSLF